MHAAAQVWLPPSHKKIGGVAAKEAKRQWLIMYHYVRLFFGDVKVCYECGQVARCAPGWRRIILSRGLGWVR